MSEDDVGIKCQGCGCEHLPVTNTERMPNGIIRRRRRCRHCGRKKVTYETTSGNVVNPFSKPPPEDPPPAG